VTGPATAVEAIAAGKQGALDIDYYLTGAAGPAPTVNSQKRQRVPFLGIPAETKIANHRVPTPFLDMEQRRTNFDRVELDYTRSRRKKKPSAACAVISASAAAPASGSAGTRCRSTP